MAPVPAVPQGQRLEGPAGYCGLVRLLPLLGCLLPTGCVPLESCLRPADRPPEGLVGQVTAVWKPEVVFTQDPLHDGQTVPGLAGRLYLFEAKTGLPVVGDGAVQVHLYNDDARGPDGKAVELERWHIDHKSLAKLLRKDTIGWGYTLFLPWGSFHPGITHVHLTVCYQAHTGLPLYGPSSPLVLHNPIINYSAQQVTGLAGPAKPATALPSPSAANAGPPGADGPRKP
jgi:hypothetical protein